MVLSTLFAALAFFQAPATPLRIGVPLTFTTALQNERKVSLRVSDASLKDVLAKLPKVDYAVDADVFKGRRITLNLTDVTTTEALNAIAAALDAHWENIGGVKVLKKGPGFGFNGTAFRTFTAPSFNKDLFLGDGKTFKAMPRIELKELFKDGKGIQGLTPEQQKEVQRALEGARKSLQAMPDVRLDMQKALEDARKEMRSQRTFKNDVERDAYDKARTEIEAKRRAIEASRGSMDAGSLLKSITPAQRELMKRQGFLKLSDLMPEQRKMTGHEGDGTFEIRITRNGETVIVKNG